MNGSFLENTLKRCKFSYDLVGTRTKILLHKHQAAPSRNLLIHRLILAAASANDRLSCCATATELTLMQQFGRCERAQHDFDTSAVGSLPPLDRSQHVQLVGRIAAARTAHTGH